MSVLKPPVNEADHFQGNRNATITLVEYGDFQCPYCRRAHPLVKRLLAEKGEEFQFVFRNFPLRKIHPYAFPAAIAAEAVARQNKYWEMFDRIFENQNRLSTRFLLLLAEDMEVDIDQFTEDSKSPEIESKVENDFESGIRSGVNRTPTFFINGSSILSYDETYESLLDAVMNVSTIG